MGVQIRGISEVEGFEQNSLDLGLPETCLV